MKKFMVLYHAPAKVLAKSAKASPKEAAKGMEAWQQWAKQVGPNLVEMGTPLVKGEKIWKGGKSAHSSKNVAGWSILQAENLTQVKKLLKGHPHLAWNAECSIEVHETTNIPGM